MKIRYKLVLAFGAIAFLSGLADFLAVATNREVKMDISQIKNQLTEKARSAGEMTEALLELRIHLLERHLDAKGPHSIALTTQFDASEARFEKNLQACRAFSDLGLKLAQNEENAGEIEDARAQIELIVEISDTFAKLMDDLNGESRDGEAKRFAAVLRQVQDYEKSVTDSLEHEVAEVDIKLRENDRILAVTGLTIVALGLGLSWIIWRALMRPIQRLTEAAERIGRGSFSSTVEVKSRDEFGLLAQAFNKMTQELQAARDQLENRVAERTAELAKTHKELLQTSRMAGMAEVATSVLHNVGNVLNSVNVSTSVIADKIKKSRAPALTRLSELIKEKQDDLGSFVTTDARGKVLPAFLQQLSDSIQGEQRGISMELQQLHKNIEHIKEIVAMQQSYARVSGVSEVVKLGDLVEDSIRMNTGSLDRHGVQIIRHFTANPTLNVEKHKVLQILVNVIRNAKYACDDSQRADKQVTVSIECDDEKARVAIADNGVGIAPENLTRIFGHGFTTRGHGHGFGLHSGAIAAKEIGGALIAQSAGPGRGATFILELPLNNRSPKP